MATINLEKIRQRILDSPVSSLAQETAGDLVQKWVEEFGEADAVWKTLGAELGFAWWIDPLSLAVGFIDRIALADFGLVGCEWKTSREKGYRYDENVWLEDISRGSQVRIYAGALADPKTQFLIDDEMTKANPFVSKKGIEENWMLVRAAVKSSPPTIWPSDPQHGLLHFTARTHEITKNALIIQAAGIRAAKLSGLLPWHLTGEQCKNRYGYFCPYFDTCKKGQHPDWSATQSLFSVTDPASRVLEKLGIGLLDTDPRLAILSASAYADATQCLERYRIVAYGLGPKEESPALQVGTAFHAGVASFYSQMIEPRSEA